MNKKAPILLQVNGEWTSDEPFDFIVCIGICRVQENLRDQKKARADRARVQHPAEHDVRLRLEDDEVGLDRRGSGQYHAGGRVQDAGALHVGGGGRGQ